MNSLTLTLLLSSKYLGLTYIIDRHHARYARINIELEHSQDDSLRSLHAAQTLDETNPGSCELGTRLNLVWWCRVMYAVSLFAQ